MKTIAKALWFCFLLLYSPSCTVYTEKQSEALSKTVYASRDSINAARIDLADQYITEATRLVKPPKQRIEIQTIYKKEISPSTTTSKPTSFNNKRVVMIPEAYKHDLVIVVKSEEYEQLLANKEIFEQIKKDNIELLEAKQTVDEELIKQNEFRDQMVKDLNTLQRQIAQKELVIIHRNLTIAGLVITIGAGIFLKFKGILL